MAYLGSDYVKKETNKVLANLGMKPNDRIGTWVHLLLIIVLVFGGILVIIHYWQQDFDSQPSSRILAVSTSTTQSVPTSTPLLYTTLPQLTYSVITPSRLEEDGDYHIDFDVTFSYVQDVNLPSTPISYETSSMTCSSPFDVSTSSVDTMKKLVFETDCSSNNTIVDDGKLFSLSSEVPTSTYPPYIPIVVDGSGSLSIEGGIDKNDTTDCSKVEPFIQTNGSNASITAEGIQQTGPCYSSLLQDNGSGTHATISSDTETVTPQN